MSKKQERIKYLFGIYNAINECGEQAVFDAENGVLAYKKETIKQVLETVKHLLKQDGIVGIAADSKVNDD